MTLPLETVCSPTIKPPGGGRPTCGRDHHLLVEWKADLFAEAFAAAEGEGDLSLAHWREAHQAHFTSNGGFYPEMLLWCERFELIAILPTPD